MIKLALVRHGQTDYNLNGLVQGRINIPLNQKGREQALELGQILAKENKHFDAILSSPLSRALETSYIVSKELNMNQPIEIIQHYTERDFSFLDGQDVKTSRALLREKKQLQNGFENDRELIIRVVKATFKLLNYHDNETLLCVAHSHVLKALMVYADPKQFDFADYYLTNGDIIYLEVDEKHIKFIDHISHPNGALK